jgi:hypothetical protein
VALLVEVPSKDGAHLSAAAGDDDLHWTGSFP